MSTSKTTLSSIKPIFLLISTIAILALTIYFLYSLTPFITFSSKKPETPLNPIKINPYESPYRVKGILNNLFYPYKSDIIRKIDEFEFLRDTLGKVDLRMVYNSNIHGDYAKDFHEETNYYHLLVLIQTEKGNRFGGYTSVNFTPKTIGLTSDAVEISKDDNCAFLFNLDNKKIYEVNDPNDAVTCDDYYTILFGDNDLLIPNYFLSKESTSEFPKFYGKNAEKNEFTGGEEKFKIVSLEAFQVLFYKEFGDEKNRMGENYY